MILLACESLAVIATCYAVRKWRASSWFKYKITSSVNEDVKGKVFVVTGANSGIGLATVKELIKYGAHVIMLCRDPKAETIARNLQKSHKDSKVEYMPVDLSDFDSVDAVCRQLRATLKHIDVLLLNAGLAHCEYSLTKEHLETQMGVNYFGHARLLFGLIPLLKKAPDRPRVVYLASSLYRNSNICDRLDSITEDARIEDLCQSKKTYNKRKAYADSKLSGMLLMKALADKYSSISFYSVSPGIVNTNLGRHQSKLFYFAMLPLYVPFALLAVRSPKQGCQTVLYCCLDKSISDESGYYYRDGKRMPCPPLEGDSPSKMLKATQDVFNRCDMQQE